MPPAPLPSNESQRLAALAYCRVMDTAPEPAFDAITRLAARLCDVPISLISLLDEERQWFKSRVGLDVDSTSRELAFCGYVVHSGETLVVEDARKDPRLQDNPLVTGPPGIRFYAGAPLRLQSGEVLGTLCVIDTETRTWTEEMNATLHELAAQAATLLEMRRAERDLARSRNLFQSIIDNSSALISAKHLDGSYMFANHRYVDLFGHETPDLVGKTDYEVFPKELADTYRANDEAAIEASGPIRFEEMVYHPDGVRRYVSVRFPLFDSDGSSYAVAGVSMDITDILKLKDELLRKNEELEQFVYAASHDLQSPLVTILGFTGCLRRDITGGRPERLLEFLDRIEEGAGRLRRNVDDLLELSRVGRAVGDLTMIDPGAIATEVVAEMQSQFDDANAVVEVGHDLPMVAGDPTRLRQVFENLLANTLKYGHPESGSLRVTIGGARHGDETRLFVADNGPGIPPEYREKVFGLFQRLASSADGTGVGLALVQRVAAVHGGRAWVEQTAGGGATFVIALPTTVASVLGLAA